ncbi:hypothetical protein PMIN04_004140 [Paraphaeosphaeria minitans]
MSASPSHRSRCRVVAAVLAPVSQTCHSPSPQQRELRLKSSTSGLALFTTPPQHLHFTFGHRDVCIAAHSGANYCRFASHCLCFHTANIFLRQDCPSPTTMSNDAVPGVGKMVSEDTVAVLLMAMGSTSITMAQYGIMSSLDGTRTASSFQHSFRSIIKKAKELQARVEAGETFEAVAPAKKRGTYLNLPSRHRRASADLGRRCS